MATPFKQSLWLRPCIKHFSHLHPLRPVDVEEKEEIICSGCELELSGSGYKCSKTKCEYFLHKSCFELPKQLQHISHTQHLLTLLPSPPHDHDSKFTCNACGDYGTAFTYHCSICSFNLHVGCAFLPNTIKHVDHNHPLSLVYSSFTDKDTSTFTCDACTHQIPHTYWIYYCSDCDYGTHLLCTVPQC